MTKRNRDVDPDMNIFSGDSQIAPTENSISMKLRQFWPFFRPGRPGELRSTSSIEAKVAKHHGPHNDAKIEWWYVNGHIGVDAATAEFSFFAAFFRLVADTVDPGLEDRTYVHALNWAIIDRKSGATVAQGGGPSTPGPKKRGYYPFSVMDPIAPGVVLDLIRSNQYKGDKQLIQSLAEMLEDNQVPLPDTLLDSVAEVSDSKLVFGESSFEIIAAPPKEADAGPDVPTPPPSFKLVLVGTQPPDSTAVPAAGAGDRKIHFELTLQPNQGPCLHGRDGVVSMGSKVDDMFYYFYPSCDVTGFEVKSCDADVFPFANRLKSAAAKVKDLAVQGRGWVDHEFGGAIPGNLAEFEFIFAETVQKRSGLEHAWEWAAILLDNGMKLSVTSLIDPVKMKEAKAGGGAAASSSAAGIVDRFAIVLHPDGRFERVDAENVTFTPTATWKSPVTSATFPVTWSVAVKLSQGGKLDFVLDAGEIKDQELVTLAAKPSFWEGFAGVSGTYTPPAPSTGSSIVVVEEVKGESTLECHGETDLSTVANSVEQLHSLLFAPLPMMVPKDTTTAAVDKISKQLLMELAAKVRPNVEMAAMMLASMAPDQPPMSPAQKEVLCGLGAAFVASAHYGATSITSDADFADQLESYIEELWKLQSANMLFDYKKILLRTFVLKELDECRKKCPALAAADLTAKKALIGDDQGAPAPPGAAALVTGGGIDGSKVLHSLTAAHSLPKEALFAFPTELELKGAAKVKDVAVAKHLYTGSWVKDWSISEKFNDMLASQNVGIIYRKLIDQLTPKMVTEVQPRFFRSRVTTSMSDDMMQDQIDGTEYKWPSSGRGQMTSRSCLMHGGQLLYTRSVLPNGCQKLKNPTTGEPLMEHKWLYCTADPEVFCQRTVYGEGAVDSFFKRVPQ